VRDKSIEYSCAAELTIDLLGELEDTDSLRHAGQPARLSQLGLIPSASKKELTEDLRKLHSVGLIARSGLSSHILHVEYDLAEPVRAGSACI
jgi:DNA-binding HxlR family transcriptional regulator